MFSSHNRSVPTIKMTRLLLLLPAVLLVSSCSAWILPNRAIVGPKCKTALFSESTKPETSSESNPCWQDIFDADCTMDSIFSARFVASEWIKELPCGSGLEVSHSYRLETFLGKILGPKEEITRTNESCNHHYDANNLSFSIS